MALTLEAVFHGEERDKLIDKLATACEHCRRAEKRLEVEFSTRPDGGSHQQRDVWRVDPEIGPHAIASSLERKVLDTIGTEFTGEIRLNFREEGDTRPEARCGSFSRMVRPPTPALPTDPGPALGEYFHRAMGIIFRLSHELGDLARAHSQLLAGSAHLVREVRYVPPPTAAPDGTPLGLIASALQVAAQATGSPAATIGAHVAHQAAQAGAGARGAQVPLPSGVTPPRVVPPPVPEPTVGDPAAQSGDAQEGAPSAGPAVDEAAIEQWARAHPGQARALVLRLMAEGGGLRRVSGTSGTGRSSGPAWGACACAPAPCRPGRGPSAS